MHLPNSNPRPDKDVLWRRFDICRQSLAAAGKSQARFVSGLLGFLALLWGWHYMKPTHLTIQVLGATLEADGLWAIAPGVLTCLVLALVGSMNIMGPIWKRLRICADELSEVFFWTDLDPNKTLIDFFTYLKIWPEGAVESHEVPREVSIHRFAVFSYPAVITFATVTSGLADYPGAPWPYRVYVYGCVSLQTLFSLRVWYRAFCRFWGIRRNQTEI
jgi:hypothetical protein